VTHAHQRQTRQERRHVETNFRERTENGKEVIISVTAGPIYRKARYDDRSQYRYDIVLSAKEVAAIAGAVNCPATRQEQ
jgi:hypothetical protein